VFVFGTLFFFPFYTQDGTQGVPPYHGFNCALIFIELSRVINYAESQHCKKLICLLRNVYKKFIYADCNKLFYTQGVPPKHNITLHSTALLRSPRLKIAKGDFPHAQRVAIKNRRFLIGDGATLRTVTPKAIRSPNEKHAGCPSILRI
jgi:hypothetical protein